MRLGWKVGRGRMRRESRRGALEVDIGVVILDGDEVGCLLGEDLEVDV